MCAKWIIAIACVTGFALLRPGATSERRHFPAITNAQLAEGLSSSHEAVRLGTYRDWKEARAQRISDLIEILRKRTDSSDFCEARELASQLLGLVRTRRATAALVANITYQQTLREETEPSPLGDYPCAAALCTIGLNAVPEILQYLSSAEPRLVTEKEIAIFADTVAVIYGYDTEENGGLAEGLPTVERFAERCRGPGRANLERLITRLKRRRD